MDYKEKFEGFLDKMQGLLDNAKKQGHIIVRVEDLENVLTELKDSDEDERMRNIAIDACKYMVDNFENSTKQYEDAIAWLEKQSEKDSQVIYPTFTFDDILALQCCMETVKKVQEDKDLYEKLNDLHGRVYDAYHFEKQGEQSNNEEAEKEKNDYVSGQFLYCKGSFNKFKEGESYWLEYVGNDKYIGRSDNILNQKFHITPRQLYTWLDPRHAYNGNETNAPTEYGKYVDECLYEASKHFFSEGEDKYSVADLFYAGVRCGKSWLEKQEGCEIIRKEWFEHLKQSWYKEGFINGKYAKQGEQKSIDDLTPQEAMDIAVAKCFEQGEQKPADKSKPNFHEGEWIVCEVTGSVYQIKNCIENLSNHRYGYDLTNGGYIGSDEINHYHLWTIEDAKAGDVLVCNDITFIFKGIKDGIVKGLCPELSDSMLNFGEPEYDNDYYPATKEQRDLLFQKMKEAGYCWDAEKKELKKVNKNTDVGHEYFSDLLEKDDCDNIDDYAYQCAYCMSHDWIRETATWDDIQKACKLGAEWKEKHWNNSSTAWSEEDKEMFNEVINNLHNYIFKSDNTYSYIDCDKHITWLKSLKDRVQPQPKQEWSEEDVYNSKLILSTINQDQDLSLETKDKLTSWLKSLKTHITWKPSKGQLECLGYAIDKARRDYSPLANSRIYLTLKALKEQLEKLTE